MTATLVFVSGPPGAGKTTLARALAADGPEAAAVHLHTDDFFDAIVRGFIPPWEPASHSQNEVVTEVIVAAALAYHAGGFKVYVDGVIGPWFLGTYRAACDRAGVAMDYVVLRPNLGTATARARDRQTAPLLNYPPNVYAGFADLGELESHVLDTTALTPSATVTLVRAGLRRGTFTLAD